MNIHYNFHWRALGGILLFSLGAHIATATYSIATTDGTHIGASGCSCIDFEGFSLLQSLYREEPGAGLLVTQALVIDEDSEPVVAGKALLSNGTDPQDILTVMTDPALDPESFNVGDGGEAIPEVDLRQYAVLDTQGRVAGYTGSRLDELYMRAGYDPSSQMDEQVITDEYTVSAQGNIVTNATVPLLISSFQEATNNANNCDLAAKLFAASNAVNLAKEGDIRCNGIVPGTLLFLRVDALDGETILEIDIPFNATEGIVNPYVKLQQDYDMWRVNNSCNDEAAPPTSGARAMMTTMTSLLIGGMSVLVT